MFFPEKMNRNLSAKLMIVLIAVLMLAIGMVNSSHSHIAVTGIVGKPVKLPCKLDASPQTLANVQWVDLVYNSNADPQMIFGSSSNPQFLIFNSHPNSVNYMVDSEYTLTILNVTLDDPGKYMCISTLTNASTIMKDYYLSVATMPTCSGNTQLKAKENTQLECSMTFSGMQPVVDWYRNGEEVKSDDFFDVRLAKKQIDIHATHSEDNITYTCKFTFNDRDESCNLTLNVRYLIPSVHITTDKEKLHPGDVVKCHAKGNPTPDITMRPHKKSDKSGPGWKTFKVGADLVDQNITIYCEASNSVDGVNEVLSKNKTLLVHAPKKVHHTTTATTTTTTTSATPVKKHVDTDQSRPESDENMKDEAKIENRKDEAETGRVVVPKAVITKDVNAAANSQFERRLLTQMFISFFFFLLFVL